MSLVLEVLVLGVPALGVLRRGVLGHVALQVLVERHLAHGPLGREMPALHEAVIGLPGQRHLDDPAAPALRGEVLLGHVPQGQHLGAAHVVHVPEGVAVRQLAHASGHFLRGDRLAACALRHEQQRWLGQWLEYLDHKIVELSGAQGRPAEPRVLDQPLDPELRAVIAERYDIHADDRDVDEMTDLRLLAGGDQVLRRRDVGALPRRRRAVHHHLRPGRGLAQARARQQIGRPPVGSPAHGPYVMSGAAQQLRQGFAEGAGSSGHQDRAHRALLREVSRRPHRDGALRRTFQPGRAAAYWPWHLQDKRKPAVSQPTGARSYGRRSGVAHWLCTSSSALRGRCNSEPAVTVRDPVTSSDRLTR